MGKHVTWALPPPTFPDKKAVNTTHRHESGRVVGVTKQQAKRTWLVPVSAGAVLVLAGLLACYFIISGRRASNEYIFNYNYEGCPDGCKNDAQHGACAGTACSCAPGHGGYACSFSASNFPPEPAYISSAGKRDAPRQRAPALLQDLFGLPQIPQLIIQVGGQAPDAVQWAHLLQRSGSGLLIARLAEQDAPAAFAALQAELHAHGLQAWAVPLTIPLRDAPRELASTGLMADVVHLTNGWSHSGFEDGNASSSSSCQQLLQQLTAWWGLLAPGGLLLVESEQLAETYRRVDPRTSSLKRNAPATCGNTSLSLVSTQVTAGAGGNSSSFGGAGSGRRRLLDPVLEMQYAAVRSLAAQAGVGLSFSPHRWLWLAKPPLRGALLQAARGALEARREQQQRLRQEQEGDYYWQEQRTGQ